MDLLIIDLDKTATYKVSLGSIILGDGNDLLEGPWYDSAGFLILIAAHHGMGFSASGLAVGEDGAVVPLDDVVD